VEDGVENFDMVWEGNRKKIDFLGLNVKEVVHENKVVDSNTGLRIVVATVDSKKTKVYKFDKRNFT
jgi:hypothetical protein